MHLPCHVGSYPLFLCLAGTCQACPFRSSSTSFHCNASFHPVAMYTTAPSPTCVLSSQYSKLLSAYPSSFYLKFRLSQQLHHVGAQQNCSTLHEIRSFAADKESSKEDGTLTSSGAPEKGKIGTAVDGSGPTKLGFGSAGKAGAGKTSKEKKKPATIRRASPQQPLLRSPADPQSQQIETAYVASLGFLGFLIFVEGIVLAASGFLPEEWDSFLVKTLYPSFTPTVGLFLLGAAGYGLVKYLGGPPPKE